MNWDVAKYAAILLVIGLWGLFCYERGREKGNILVSQLRAVQAAEVAHALEAQKSAQAAEEARLNAIIAKYESTPINPIVLGVATRLLYATAHCNSVPGASPNPAGTGDTIPVSARDREIERLTQAAFDACDADAKQLDALIDAWPH